MARPLQKKKNKSSLSRIRQRPKSKHLNIKSNPIVAANWDQSLTLTQNYRRLGLSSKLNSSTGGTEKTASLPPTHPDQRSALAIPSSKLRTTFETKSVKVVRDPTTGAILGVQREEGEKRRANPLGDLLNGSSEDEEEEEGVEEGREEEAVGRRKGGRGIVPLLEEQALYERKKRPRVQSQREKEWIERLVGRWGEDWGGMVRDRKLNPMQQSEGDLRRRVEIWREGRGKGGGESEIVL